MAKVITKEDFRLASQTTVSCALKIEILNEDETVLDILYGVIDGGTSNIDASSDIRRTCSFVVVPTTKNDIKICENSYIWLNKNTRVMVGIRDIRTQKYTWYSQGHYIFNNVSIAYNADANTLTVNCNDFMSFLDGTRNGQLGALTTTIPAYRENPDTGEVIEYNYIKDAMRSVVTQLGKVKRCMIDDIGEYKGLEKYNPNYMEYRQEYPEWNCIPYDLEFSQGCSVLSIIQGLRDLYPNNEIFFNIDNVFVCQMIPSFYDDDVIINNDQLQRVLISEDTTIDFTEVKNVSEVWGNVIEEDFYADSVTCSNNTYYCAIEGYEDSYESGDIIAIKVPTSNVKGQSIRVNSLSSIQIYDGEGIELLDANVMHDGEVHCFKIKKKYDSKTKVYNHKALHLGQWQPHALHVLCNSERHNEKYTTSNGVVVEKYSKEYFQDVYNVEMVQREIIPDSPFSVEKIGEILSVEQKDSVFSDKSALALAEYNNWKNCRLTDNITITTLLLPFLDVNIKVAYKASNSDEINQYIIDSVAQDYTNGLSTITMHRFYPLYK